jgi:hypothetical protein
VTGVLGGAVERLLVRGPAVGGQFRSSPIVRPFRSSSAVIHVCRLRPE